MTNVGTRIGSLAALTGCIAIAICFLHFFPLSRMPTLAIGDSAPVIPLQTMDGRQITTKDLGGRARAILFVNPSCGLCRSTIRRLCTARQSWKNMFIVSPADAAQTKNFSDSLCSIGTWALAMKEDIVRKYGIRALPTLIVFGPDNLVHHISVGIDVGSSLTRLLPVTDPSQNEREREHPL